MKKILKKLTLIYYLIYIAVVLVALLGFQLHRSGVVIDSQSQAGIIISSLLIILIIGSIPITLAIFNKKTKKWATEDDVPKKLALYSKASVIRLIIIGTGFLLGILFFFLMNSQSMIFCAGISAIGLFFCKPADVKIISELQIEEAEKY
ncbi:MAG: hypothetical protein PHQ11_14625 [Paludibacter sp.]|nr:hypothetical protein [Paludibacter sp.]MDD4199150.1 hypothetical protein [Paludibacter sp.]MDD4427331.1 hypothetical protein [Paludibacter sp.]